MHGLQNHSLLGFFFGVAAHINKFKNVILCLIDLSTTFFWAYFFKLRSHTSPGGQKIQQI